MKETILLKYGEIALKGLNKNSFEDVLVKNIKRRIKSLGKFKVWKAQSTIYVEPLEEDIDTDEATQRLSKVFGIAALTRAITVPKDFEEISKATIEYLSSELSSAKTFKVEAKRSDKHFPLTTPEIQRELGGVILSRFHHLKVDVHNPEVRVVVEIRDNFAYVHTAQMNGAGGMPIGASGNGMLLLSGGIDSPVAGYMMAKRGVTLSAVHFESPPYTSERAKKKVLKLGKELCEWCGRLDVYVVPFTEIQEEIRNCCKEEYFTVIMRRFMMKIASFLAENVSAGALITGESIAQVASQTMDAIVCTNEAATLPVYRPLIGFDKNDIVEISRKIGTFETSIEPYEDCCTVFTPRHPKTHPNLEEILTEEKNLQIDVLVEKATRATEIINLRNDF